MESHILFLGKPSGASKKIRTLLENADFKVTKLSKCSSSFNLLQQKDFGLVIIDQFLTLGDHTPVINMLLQQVKSSSVPHPPMIMITQKNFSNQESYPEVDGFINENTHPDEVLSIIKTAIEAGKYFHHDTSFSIIESAGEEMRDFFDRELALRDKELSSYALLVSKKNKQLQEIKSILDKTNKRDSFKNLSQLKLKVNNFLNEVKIIDSFFTHFNKMHVDFFIRLDAKADFTEIQKRHCACLKMGMDNKQIASLFSIQTESIKKAHARIKKKLYLKPEQSLRKYIINL
jgi:DNA-binding NarL/FixJ family response regulator